VADVVVVVSVVDDVENDGDYDDFDFEMVDTVAVEDAGDLNSRH